MTEAYTVGANKPFYGLLPQSISHEGYSAKPMHSYWDDFFALRGFKDAAFIAKELDKPRSGKLRADPKQLPLEPFRVDPTGSDCAPHRLHPGLGGAGGFRPDVDDDRGDARSAKPDVFPVRC